MNLRRILLPVASVAALVSAGWLAAPSDVHVFAPAAVVPVGESRFVVPVVRLETPRNWRRVLHAMPSGERLVPRSEPALDPSAERVAQGASTSGVTIADSAIAAPGTVTGRSWELAVALAEIDAATPGSLTGEAVVAATGTVAADGTVGPVAGLSAKHAAAGAAGATVMLAPGGHGTGSGPTLEVVETVSDAVAVLCALGADDAVCTGGVTS